VTQSFRGLSSGIAFAPLCAAEVGVMRARASFLGVFLIIGALAVGCSRGGGTGGSGGDTFGSIAARLSFDASDGIAAVRVDVQQGGQVVASQVVLPGSGGTGVVDGGGQVFGDAFFVLQPGTYMVTAAPLDASGKPSERCASASASATVNTGATTEIVLGIFCNDQGSGGLDVVVTTEHPPAITGLRFDPGKFTAVCQPVAIVVDAVDPDGLPLSYAWSVIVEPPGADSPLPPGVAQLLTPQGNTATFETAVAGEYTLGVAVSDPNGHAASLTFPVHVSDGPGCAGTQKLTGYLTPDILHAPIVGPLPGATMVELAVGLPVVETPGLPGLEGFVQQVSDPASPSYRQFLTPSQFESTFAPPASDYQALTAWATSNGLTVEASYSNRLLLDVSGTADQIEKALFVSLQLRKRDDGSSFYAPDREPSLNLAVQILRISGLDNLFVPTHDAGSGPGGNFWGTDFRNAYAACATTNTGAGQSVGLFQFDGFNAADVTSYEMMTGIAAVPVNTTMLNGFSGAAGNNRGEVLLDIDMALSMAPGLDGIMVFEGTQANSILAAMGTTMPLSHQLSSSWHYHPDGNTQQLMNTLAAQGQTFFQSSGDSGSYPSDPGDHRDVRNITVVGGTVLSMNGSGASYQSETAWPGAGGGILTNVPIPGYQQGFANPSNGGSATDRNVPDVGLTATGIDFIQDGMVFNGSGTSFATPLWAGFMALVNAQSQTNGAGFVGFANPAFYAMSNVPAVYATSFNDITSGSNGTFSAVPGYDLVTGLGSPQCGLIAQLSTLSPTVPATNSLIQFELDSGNDGVNSDSIVLANLFANGASSPFQTLTLKVKGDGSWDPKNLPHTVTQALSPPQPVGGIAKIDLVLVESDPGCNTFCDNWTVQKVGIRMFNPSGPQFCLIDLTGGPDENDAVARLTKDSPSKSFFPRSGCP
jgi:kumamolisin